jgi:hypothetical protein
VSDCRTAIRYDDYDRIVRPALAIHKPTDQLIAAVPLGHPVTPSTYKKPTRTVK